MRKRVLFIIGAVIALVAFFAPPAMAFEGYNQHDDGIVEYCAVHAISDPTTDTCYSVFGPGDETTDSIYNEVINHINHLDNGNGTPIGTAFLNTDYGDCYSHDCPASGNTDIALVFWAGTPCGNGSPHFIDTLSDVSGTGYFGENVPFGNAISAIHSDANAFTGSCYKIDAFNYPNEASGPHAYCTYDESCVQCLSDHADQCKNLSSYGPLTGAPGPYNFNDVTSSIAFYYQDGGT